MGEDKSGIDPFGSGPLLETPLRALVAAGAQPVAVVGRLGSAPAGAISLPDRYPGEGPLGGIITALHWSPHDLVVVVACDMPFLTAESVAELVSAAWRDPSRAGVFAELDGRVQPLTAVWRRSLALDVLAEEFSAGQRAPRRLLDRLPVETIRCSDHESLVDLDSPADIHRYAPLARRRARGD